MLLPKRDIHSQVGQLICHLICLHVDVGCPKVLKLYQKELYLTNVFIKVLRLHLPFLDSTDNIL